MLKSLKQLFQEAKNSHISEDEKSLIRSRLQIYVRNNLHMRQHMYGSKLKTFKLTYIKPMSIFIVIMLVLGGTSFAAEKTLPGDALYDVKVHVNESVGDWFAISDEAQAMFETKLAERRLEEAEELAAESKLNAENRVQLEESFSKFADRVENRINMIEEKNPEKAAEISANFETSLKAHERILSDIASSVNGEAGTQVQGLVVQVKAEQNSSIQNKTENEARLGVNTEINVKDSAEGRLHAAENKIAEARNFVNNHSDELSVEIKAQIEAKLKATENLVIQGKVKLEASAYNESFVLFSRAHGMAQEVKLLIEAKIHFGGWVCTQSFPMRCYPPSRKPSWTPCPAGSIPGCVIPSPSVSESPMPTPCPAGLIPECGNSNGPIPPPGIIRGGTETKSSVNSRQGLVNSQGHIQINIGE